MIIRKAGTGVTRVETGNAYTVIYPIERTEAKRSPQCVASLDGCEVVIYRDDRGVLTISIDPNGDECNEDGTPKVDVWVVDALVHHHDGTCRPINAERSEDE